MSVIPVIIITRLVSCGVFPQICDEAFYHEAVSPSLIPLLSEGPFFFLFHRRISTSWFDFVSLCYDTLTAGLLCLLQELQWSLSPQTPISWLNVYMQVAYLKETDELLLPRYPQTTFTQIAEVHFLSCPVFWEMFTHHSWMCPKCHLSNISFFKLRRLSSDAYHIGRNCLKIIAIFSGLQTAPQYKLHPHKFSKNKIFLNR